MITRATWIAWRVSQPCATLCIHVPVSATEQAVRLYRNAREDSLLTQVVTPGMTYEKALTLDAVKDDRFYLAISPTGQGSQLIGVHFYVNATGRVVVERQK